MYFQLKSIELSPSNRRQLSKAYSCDEITFLDVSADVSRLLRKGTVVILAITSIFNVAGNHFTFLPIMTYAIRSADFSETESNESQNHCNKKKNLLGNAIAAGYKFSDIMVFREGKEKKMV